MRAEQIFENGDQGVLVIHQPLTEVVAGAGQVLRRLERHRVAQRPTDHVLLELRSFAVFDAVEEHVLDVGFLGCVEGMRGSQLLIVLLQLFELLLQDGDVEVAGAIICVEEAANSLLRLGLRALFAHKKVYDEVTNLVVG